MFGVGAFLAVLQAVPLDVSLTSNTSAGTTDAAAAPAPDAPPAPPPKRRWRTAVRVAGGYGNRWLEGLRAEGGDIVAAVSFRKHAVGLMLEGEAFIGATPAGLATRHASGGVGLELVLGRVRLEGSARLGYFGLTRATRRKTME